MDMRPVIEPQLGRQPLAEPVDGRQVVNAEGVGRAHGGNDRRNRLACRNRLARGSFEGGDIDRIVAVRRHTNDVVLPDPEPACHIQAGIVAVFGAQNDGASRAAVLARAWPGLLQADLHAVEECSRASERE